MPTITKKELIDQIAHGTQTKQSLVKATVQNFLEEIISELAEGNRIEFRDFGVFELREHGPRITQNPITHEQVHAPAKRVVKYKAGRLMKRKMNCLEAIV